MPVNNDMMQLGIVGLALIVMWKMLDLAKLWWITRNGKTMDGVASMSKLQCMKDPLHYENIKRTAANVDWLLKYSKTNEPIMQMVREGIPKGDFGCTWKDRDEVLNMIHAMKENTRATNYLTTELRKQNGR